MKGESQLLTASDLGSALRQVGDVVRPSETFMAFAGDSGTLERLSFRETLDRVARLGALYSSWGLGPGDRVVVSSTDDAAVVVLVLSCLVHGLSAVIVDPEATANEVSLVIDTCTPGAALVDRDSLARWPLDTVPTTLGIVPGSASRGRLFDRLLGGAQRPEPGCYPGVLAGLDPIEAPDELSDELEAYVLFTSGSTAGPKGVSVSRRSLLCHARTLSSHLGYGRGTRLMAALPLSHTDGLIHGCLVPWLNAASCLRPVRFSVARVGELLDAVYTHRATHLLVVPTLLSILLRSAEGYEEAFRTEDFELVISSAELLDPTLWERFQETFDTPVANIYGLTETVVGGLYCGPDEETFKLGTVGKPVDCEVRIVDQGGRDLGPGQAGELLIRGELLMTGYVADPEATAAALDGGWLHTGDIALRDDGGFFHIVGRSKNLVISGGRNVHPEEVSEALHRIPGVVEAVAFGVEDEILGEIVAACVVRADACQLEPENIVTECRRWLSPHKVPRVVARAPALPRGPSGKVAVDQARRLFEESRIEPPDVLGDEDIAERVRAAAARLFGVPQDRLGPGSRSESTPGWDSFAHLRLVVALEEGFGVRFATGDIVGLQSLADAERIIRNRLRGPAGEPDPTPGPGP